MGFPRLLIDLAKLETNARWVTDLCRRHGVSVFGVTKACCGDPEVGGAMLRGGVEGLADSRLINLRRLKEAGIKAPLLLLRSPMPSEIPAVVQLAGMSLNSDPGVIRELDRQARQQGVLHRAILMVDLGDLREGVWPDRVLELVREVHSLEEHARDYATGVRLAGLGTNFACFGGVVPSLPALGGLAELAGRCRREVGVDMPVLSGGNSTSLHLLAEGAWQPGINHLRVGESILLGYDLVSRRPFAGMHQDAFLLEAEVIETGRKPSVPTGEIGFDAFGNRPHFEDRGLRQRAIVALGKQDLGAGHVMPEEAGVEVVGASSDHLILDVTAAAGPVRVGDRLRFRPDYGAILGACTSPYVEKITF